MMKLIKKIAVRSLSGFTAIGFCTIVCCLSVVPYSNAAKKTVHKVTVQKQAPRVPKPEVPPIVIEFAEAIEGTDATPSGIAKKEELMKQKLDAEESEFEKEYDHETVTGM